MGAKSHHAALSGQRSRMPSPDPTVGKRYLTATGAPVQVLEVHEGIMTLQGLASDNRLRVPVDYPLRQFDPKQAVGTMRPRPYTPRSKSVAALGSPAAAKPLAPLIDAMLLAGGHTMRGIVRELRRKASAACRGKDLKANVRARLYWLKRRGHVLNGSSLTVRGVASR